MKKHGLLLAVCLLFLLDGVSATAEQEKTYNIRREIEAFVVLPDMHDRLHMKHDFIRAMLNTIDKCMVIAKKPSGWDRLVDTFFYSIFPGGVCEFESAKGLLLLQEDDAPLLHACLQKLCQKTNVPKPLVFLNCQKDFVNAMAGSFGQHHALIVVGKSLIDKMSDQGLAGALAHELAHIKHNHMPKLLVIGLTVFTLMMLLLRYDVKGEIKNAVKGIGVFAVFGLIAVILTRIFEEHADDTAIYDLDEADNFVDGMEELSADVLSNFETYKKECEFLQKKLSLLVEVSPRLAGFLKWIFERYDKMMRNDYEATLYGLGGDHPSLLQRIAAGKVALEEKEGLT